MSAAPAFLKSIWALSPRLLGQNAPHCGRGSGEWGRDRYQSHRPERNHHFANEVVGFVDEVVSTGGYAHLFLAGTPRMTGAIREALPKRLASKLILVVAASANERTSAGGGRDAG